MLPDARGVGRFLRVSWHPDADQFVVSTWDGDRCVGAVRLMADTAAELAALLATGLSDAVGGQAADAGAA
jgi:hypothetical protein